MSVDERKIRIGVTLNLPDDLFGRESTPEERRAAGFGWQAGYAAAVETLRPNNVEPAESSVQALAGARLFYCLYHDAEAVKWLLGRAFGKAYMGAQRAFLPDERKRPDEDDNPYWFTAQREAIHPDDATRLVAQGRREAAEVIRQQGRVSAAGRVLPEGVPGTMLSFEVAARLAEGGISPGSLATTRETETRDEVIHKGIAIGRKQAADAIRTQARMYARSRGDADDAGTLIDAEEAARLAEGQSGVKAAGNG